MLDDLDIILETIDEAKAKVRKPSEIGLSQKQLSIHYDDLYHGYIRKLREIRTKLAKANRPKSDAVYSEYRELKMEESFAFNGVRLHELYFDNIGKKADMPAEFKAVIKKHGNYRTDEWRREMIACARVARGWVVMGYDHDEDKFRVMVLDSHNIGAMMGMCLILVLDMYEHAYMIDFGSKKDGYINWFMDHIKWDSVMRRINDIDALNDTIVG